MNSNPNHELTLQDLAVVYRRRRRVIYLTVAVLGFLAAIYCVFSTRQYEATGTVQVQDKSQDRLGLENMTGASADGTSDALAANINIQTQANILQSDTLALKTIEELHLENTPDFKPRWSPIGWVLGLFSPKGLADPPNASLEDSPQRRQRVLAVFSKRLSAQLVSGTRLIKVVYLNPDPKVAAAVVNKLMQSLIGYSFQAHYDATNQAATWLSSQLSDLRQQSETLRRQVADLESKSGVYNLGTVGPKGSDQNYSGTLDSLQQATTALSQAEQNRILRGAILQAAENGDAEMLSGLAGNTANGGSVGNTLSLIQSLRSQEATQEAALQQAQTKFGPAYPRLQELRGNIAALQGSIKQEIERLKQRARTDYEDATRSEAETRSQYDKAKAQADTLNDKSVEFTILRQEADESEKLYQTLLERFKEAGVLESLNVSAITVVDPARVPYKPTKPNTPLILLGALAGGFLLGCCIALVLDMMDSKINTVEEVEQISGDNLFGVTPAFNASQVFPYQGTLPLATLGDPRSQFLEATRAIRTEIFLKGDGEASKVILVTSSIPGEGKTTLSTNLAVLLAQSSKKVLLIDTDLRIGHLRTLLNLPSGTGLSELLSGELQQPEIHAVSEVPNLDALQAGEPPSNPSELLGSDSFRRWLSVWREKYDYIVLDSAPLLVVTDSLSLAPYSDITLLIARPGLTEKAQLTRSFKLLTRSTENFVATVLNGLRPEQDGYVGYFGYGKSEQKYGEMVKAK